MHLKMEGDLGWAGNMHAGIVCVPRPIENHERLAGAQQRKSRQRLERGAHGGGGGLEGLWHVNDMTPPCRELD